MKKVLFSTLLVSILCSQVGCLGDKPQNKQPDFPYATPAIKEKLAKRINPNLKTIPEDFFETFDYTEIDMDLDDLLATLDTEEQKQFWKTLISLRLAIALTTVDRENGSNIINQTFENNPLPSDIIDNAITYEENNPYRPDLAKIEEMREFIIGMALGNLPIPPSQEQAEAYIEQWGGRDTAKLFKKIREEILQTYKNLLKSGQTPQEYAETKKAEAGITEYTVHFQAPELYPAELFAAELILDPNNDDARYAFPTLFLKNATSINSARIENEKPLPYKLDLLWYSIAENKVYSLQTQLPHAQLVEKLMGGEDKPWDSLLFTLTPHGKVTMYAYNQVTQKKEKLAGYRAKEETVELSDLHQAGARLQYESADAPAQNWPQYQQQALEYHKNAAQNLKNNGIPHEEDEDADYWTTDASPRVMLPPADEINLPDAEGFTLLVKAVRAQDKPLFHRLLTVGADLNLPAPATGETPLGAAAGMGHTHFLSELLFAGADVNARNSKSGRTPLMEAAMSGYKDAVQILLDHGANVNARVILYGQRLNENALSIALKNDHTDIAQLLRQAGAEELQEESLSEEVKDAASAAYATMGMGPVHTAIIMGDIPKLQELISAGADINTQAQSIGTPLLYACSIGNTQAARLLIDAKADVNLSGQDTGYTPLLMACQTGNTELVKLLLAAGANVNAKHSLNGTETGLTPLSAAQMGGFEEIVSLLQQAGAK